MKKIIVALVLTLSVFALSAKEKPLRILYWNVQNGMWADQQNNYDNFVEFVKSENPDICVWCEAGTRYISGTSTKLVVPDEQYLPFNWDLLARRYGHNYAVICGCRDTFPQVITSRYPIVVDKRLVGDGGDIVVVHGAGQAHIEVGKYLLNIVTLHTWPQKYAYRAEDIAASRAEQGGDVFRAAEMKFVCENTIGQDADAGRHLWLFLGDFNAISSRDNFHYNLDLSDKCFLANDYVLENTPYLDVIAEKYPGDFQPTTFSGRRIDMVYMTRPLFNKVKDIHVIRDGFAKNYRLEKMHGFCNPSDHYPILMDLDMRAR